MKIRTKIIALWTILLIGLPLGAQSDDLSTQERLDRKASVQLGIGLVDYGQKNKDGLAIATGVRMLNRAGAAVKEVGDAENNIDRMALLEEARNYAGNDEAISAVLDSVQLETEKAKKAIGLWNAGMNGIAIIGDTVVGNMFVIKL